MRAEELKQRAREAGADLTGIAPATRWDDWPEAKNPKTLMPACRSVIVVGKRLLRGNLRGVEEGTNFGSTYGHFGAQWMEHTFMVRTVYEIACALEREGYEAMPLMGGATPGATVQLDTKALGHLAGLGEIGKGGFFLSRQFGHRQRLALILTDMELDGDQIDAPGFCQDCDACLRACPLTALHDDGAPQFACNEKLCQLCENGKIMMPSPSFETMDRLAASCGRACMVALEAKIEDRFDTPFRKRSVWQRDLEGQYTVIPLSEEK